MGIENVDRFIKEKTVIVARADGGKVIFDKKLLQSLFSAIK